MFRLLRFFSVISAIAFVIVGILLFGLVPKLAIGDLIEFEENKNVALAEAIIESLRSRFPPDDADTLRLQSGTFREAVQAQLRESSVVRVQIYDLEGLTLFSTDESEVGTYASEISNSRLASQGRIASGLTHRAGLGDFEGIIEGRDFVSSYIPMRFDNPIEESILGVHSDVTRKLRQTKETQQNVVVAILLILSTLFIVLFASVRIADRIIQGQYAARQRAERTHARQLSEALENERKYNALHREFVSMASHEFRTPLAIIDGAAQRIIRRAEGMSPDELLERVGKIRHAVTRMVRLIDSTLSASRMEAGCMELAAELCNLHDILEAVCRRQREIAPGNDITLDLCQASKLIVADPKQLDQVFTNLLSNAVKYSLKKGRIEVIADSEGDMAVIQVRDRGVGIPADEIPKLYERFFRASTSTGIPGTGIGLNLVKQLVEMHGGSIDVASIEGDGSTFTVRLPMTAVAEDVGPTQVDNDANLGEARIAAVAQR